MNDVMFDLPEGVKFDAEKPHTALIDPSILERHPDEAVRALGRWANERQLHHLYAAFDALGLWHWEMAEILTAGAAKYSPHNWRLGLAWSRMYEAALRHLFRGPQHLDEETGKSSRAHAGCEIMFLIVHQEQSLGEDDMSGALGFNVY